MVDEYSNQTLGPYRLIERLGTGNQAEVWLAIHSTLGIQRAIKILRSTGDSSSDIVEEARRIAAIESNTVVQIFDAGVQNGDSWFAMSLMEGGTLENAFLNRDSKASANEIKDIALRIASALEAAHKQNIIHRDVKPSNVLLDYEGKCYLADFGVAVQSTDELRGGTQVGTLNYMAPEVLEGKSSEASDMYSLGAILYWVWTGTESPIFAQSPVQWSESEDDPELKRLIENLLSGNPNNRPSATNLLDELLFETDSDSHLAKSDRYQTSRKLLLSVLSTIILIIAVGYFFLSTTSTTPSTQDAITQQASPATGSLTNAAANTPSVANEADTPVIERTLDSLLAEESGLRLEIATIPYFANQFVLATTKERLEFSRAQVTENCERLIANKNDEIDSLVQPLCFDFQSFAQDIHYTKQLENPSDKKIPLMRSMADDIDAIWRRIHRSYPQPAITDRARAYWMFPVESWTQNEIFPSTDVSRLQIDELSESEDIRIDFDLPIGLRVYQYMKIFPDEAIAQDFKSYRASSTDQYPASPGLFRLFRNREDGSVTEIGISTVQDTYGLEIYLTAPRQGTEELSEEANSNIWFPKLELVIQRMLSRLAEINSFEGRPSDEYFYTPPIEFLILLTQDAIYNTEMIVSFLGQIDKLSSHDFDYSDEVALRTLIEPVTATCNGLRTPTSDLTMMTPYLYFADSCISVHRLAGIYWKFSTSDDNYSTLELAEDWKEIASSLQALQGRLQDIEQSID